MRSTPAQAAPAAHRENPLHWQKKHSPLPASSQSSLPARPIQRKGNGPVVEAALRVEPGPRAGSCSVVFGKLCTTTLQRPVQGL